MGNLFSRAKKTQAEDNAEDEFEPEDLERPLIAGKHILCCASLQAGNRTQSVTRPMLCSEHIVPLGVSTNVFDFKQIQR